MSTYLITGATSGLGLQVARRLAQQGEHTLILPVRDAARGAALHQTLAAEHVQVRTPLLDLATLENVAAFVKSAAELPALDGVLLNAGVQSAGRLEFNAQGVESTFAVNHLAHHLLISGLLKKLSAQAIVVWTASGTHDPKEFTARLSGYRGAQYRHAAQLAAGDYGAKTTPAQACRDAYASSKLCNIVSARIFAERHPQARFYAFDPGLMPGTGLARDFPAPAQWLWKNVLPFLSRLLPGSSTPARSAGLLVDILTGRQRGSVNGAYFNYTGKQAEAAAPANERWVAEDLAAGSEQLLQRLVTNQRS